MRWGHMWHTFKLISPCSKGLTPFHFSFSPCVFKKVCNEVIPLTLSFGLHGPDLPPPPSEGGVFTHPQLGCRSLLHSLFPVKTIYCLCLQQEGLLGSCWELW